MVVITRADEVKSDVVPYNILEEYTLEKTIFNKSKLFNK